jgi:hypothetical protein
MVAEPAGICDAAILEDQIIASSTDRVSLRFVKRHPGQPVF